MAPGNPSTARSFAFTFWVLVFVAASLAWPGAFGTWLGFDLKGLIVPLIQVIMFGMGTTLSLGDFARVIRMPWPVLLGMGLQFAVMPLGGFLIARAMGFEPEVATGIILVGSVSGGVASNVMAYIARGDVALSVTMTASSTILSPFATPRLMDLLAGQYMSIPVEAMTVDIINMILVPIAAGLLAHAVLYGDSPRLVRTGFLVTMALLAAGAAAAAALLPLPPDVPRGLRTGVAIGSGLIALVAIAKWIGRVALGGGQAWVDRALPVVSMVCICFIIAIITARSREELLTVGPLLILAAAAHNGLGYTLGYWGARLLRLPERLCRTVSFEVGMQNAGMASALALGTLGSASAALAPAIFGPWMNVSGSVLATFWRRRPIGPDPMAGDLRTRASQAGGSQEGGVQEGGVQEGGVQEGGVQEGGVQEGGVQEGGVQEGGVQEGGVQEGGVQEGGVQEETSRASTRQAGDAERNGGSHGST